MLVENLLLTVVEQMLLRETLLHAIALNEIVAFPEIKVNSIIHMYLVLVKTICYIEFLLWFYVKNEDKRQKGPKGSFSQINLTCTVKSRALTRLV